MPSDLEIQAKILATLQGKGFTEAEAGLNKAGRAAKEAAGQLSSAQTAAEQLGEQLKRYLGAAALGALIKTSVVEFAAYERSLSAIAKQIETLGGNAGDSLPQIRAFLETLERTSGTARQDLVPSFQKFLGLTGSVEGAMYAVGLAADLVEANFGDMGAVGERVAQLFGARVSQAALGFGVAMRKANGEQKTAVEILQELDRTYRGFGATQKDAADKLDQASAGWNDFKQTLGKGVAPALDFVALGMANLTRVIQSIGAGIIVIGNAFGAMIAAVATTLPKLFDLKTLFSDGPSKWAAGMKDAFLGAIDKFRPELEGGMEELKAIWTRSGQDQGAALAKGMDDALKVARRKQLEQEQEDRAKAAKEAAEKAAKEEERRLEQSAEMNADWAERTAEAVARGWADGSIKRLEADLDLLELQRQHALENAEKIQADTRDINAAFDLEREALIADYDGRYLRARREQLGEEFEQERDAEIALIDSKLELLSEADERRLALLERRLELEMEAELSAAGLTAAAIEKIRAKFRNRQTKARIEFDKDETARDKAVAANKAELNLMAARDSVRILTAVFGENKAFAIAVAIIDTWLAVNNALASVPYPYNIIAAAAVAAEGLANVHKIRTTDRSKGAGFDDPVQDRMAYMGGRRWAQDLLRNLDLGFQEVLFSGARGGDGGSVTYDQSDRSSMTVNFGHVLGGRAEARRIARILDRARERDQGRTFR